MATNAAPRMQPTIFLSCAVFILYLLLLPTNPGSMFTDPDTFWHIATGDLIRSLGELPEHDSWSMTAGNEPWYNLAWAWDVAVSYIFQHGGWHGLIIANSIVIAATFALVFANCLLRSRDGLSAFMATLLFAVTLCSYTLRSFQVSALFSAGVLLLLTQVAQGYLSKRWLSVIPPLMVLWVNLHGGFIMAFFLIGFFGLAALLAKRRHLFYALLATGVASLAACIINPYGIYIVQGVSLTLTTKGRVIIHEWHPFYFSLSTLPATIYLLVFSLLVLMRPAAPGVTRAETWIMYLWLYQALASIRNLMMFGIVSVPMLALAMRRIIFLPAPAPVKKSEILERLCRAGTHALNSAWALTALALIAAGCCFALFTPASARLYDTVSYNPLPDLTEEIDYITAFSAKPRFLNAYNLGGPLIFSTRGKIPVWIDGRERTAYPKSVIDDYIAFHDSTPGWTDIFDRYRLDGALIMRSDLATIDRFQSRKGWHTALKGKTAIVFVRDR